MNARIPSRRPMVASRAAALTLAVLATLGCGRKKPPADAAASLVVVVGSVRIQRGGQTLVADKGFRLVIGDVISTGLDSRVEVSFGGENLLRLGPISSAVIQGDPGGTPSVELNQGAARAATRGLHLVIGTPFGRADIANGSEVEVSASSGFLVHLGSIDVTFADGKKLSIPTGGRFPKVAKAAGRPMADLVTKPLTFTLSAPSRQVQIKRAADAAWRASKPRETLGQGDAVRTRKAESTRLQLDERTSVLLGSNTDVVAKESGLTAEGCAAHLGLRVGSAKFVAVRDGGGAGRHEVELAGQRLWIAPGLEEADVEVSIDGEGQGRIVVQLGRAGLPGGETVEAGYAVALRRGVLVGAPAPLAETFVEVKAGRKAEVYCGGRVPPVRFTWEPGTAKAPFTIELARDNRYAKKLFREEVSRPSLVYGLLKPGTWYWRVRLADTWHTGVVRIERDQSLDCPKCKRINVIEDTGRDTTVYFQEKLPAITLRWSAVAGAAKYRLRLYDEDSLDKPRIDKTIAKPELALAAGRLPEGSYAWHMQALAADNRPRLRGAVNRLTIAYDNAISGLRIRTPRRGATTRDTTQWTKGEIALGAKLLINGNPAALDRKGRFSEKVAVRKGYSQIVYRVPGVGRDQYWVRDIVAK